MRLKAVYKAVDYNFYKKVIVEEPEEYQISKKTLLRKQINDEVFDIYDSVADNAKMISLLFAIISRIYDALPKNIKDKLDPKEREILEYAFKKYHSIQTKADIDFAKEGKKLIDKIMDRQAKIGELAKKIYYGEG